MKLGNRFNITPEKAIGLAVVLSVHALGLVALWSYQIIPPPAEALVVFAQIINPPAAAKRPAPAAPKPAAVPAKPVPIKPRVPHLPQLPQPVAPVVEHLLASRAPVVSKEEPTVVVPPVVAVPAPVAVSARVSAAPVSVPGPPQEEGSGMPPVQLSGDLSVICSERTPPVYPKQSIRRNEQGKTVLLVELDETGRVVNASVRQKSGFSRLDEAAITAVKSWRCTPAKHNRVAVHAIALQPFNFTLKGP
jgi:periplasmic protein TonB